MKVCPRQQQGDIGILHATGQALRGYIGQGRMGRDITIPNKGKVPIKLAQLVCLPGVEPWQWGLRKGTESLSGYKGSSFCSAPGMAGRSGSASQ